MAYKSSARGTRPVSIIGIHSAEGARTARALAAYFARADVEASSHVAIDGAETLPLVPYDRAAWTMRSANPISDNAELCGFARWSREQWLSSGTVDGVVNPRAMLDRTADWIRWRCDARGIDRRKLTVVQLRAGYWGVIAHADWTEAMNDGTHWDPGPGFPWDYVMARVVGGGAPAPGPSVSAPEEVEMIVIPKGGASGKPDSFPLPIPPLFEHDVTITVGDSRMPVVFYGSYHWGWAPDREGGARQGLGGNPIPDRNAPRVIYDGGGFSFIVPKGTQMADLLYWCDADFHVTISRRS